MIARAIPIVDRDDPRIAHYRDVRERDLVGREGRFVVEGEVVLGVFLHSGRFAPESILVAENRLPRLEGILAEVGDHVPIYAAAGVVMDAIVGFPIHRGILAIGVRGDMPSTGQLLERLGPKALVLAMIGLANHDNVGGIFRNAAAFGADAVLLDEGSCDPLYRKAIRVSVGGSLIVPFARGGSAEGLLDELEGRGFTPYALSPSGVTEIGEVDRSDRAALLLGAEGPGLPDAVLARTRTIRIAMAGGFDSLNVATTSGIALHAFRR
jgi:tRNA G18 (ribose-2'-O)-methylase SpoU